MYRDGFLSGRKWKDLRNTMLYHGADLGVTPTKEVRGTRKGRAALDVENTARKE